jgi:hypothetical protein
VRLAPSTRKPLTTALWRARSLAACFNHIDSGVGGYGTAVNDLQTSALAFDVWGQNVRSNVFAQRLTIAKNVS